MFSTGWPPSLSATRFLWTRTFQADWVLAGPHTCNPTMLLTHKCHVVLLLHTVAHKVPLCMLAAAMALTCLFATASTLPVTAPSHFPLPSIWFVQV